MGLLQEILHTTDVLVAEAEFVPGHKGKLLNYAAMAADYDKSDHDLLIEIRVKLELLLGANQESRIRALENFRWWILGASSALSFLGGMAAHLLLGK